MQRLEHVPLRALPAVRRPPSILVVDDEPLVRHVLVKKLRHHGFDVREAPDGEEALELVHRDPPDLVLTDLHMPRCDGERLCQMLKSDPVTSEMSVVLMTAGPTDEDLMRGIGFDDVLYKPLPHDLPDLLRSLLAAGSGEPAHSSQAPGPTESTPARAWGAGSRAAGIATGR
jgi:CheY-like chemotaxis protein